jgi:hypothetical protein
VKQLGFARFQAVQKPFALSFTSHFPVRRKGHPKFGTRKGYGRERLPGKEGCLYVAWCHGFRS